MRILELCLSHALGGNELYVERIGRELARDGHEVTYALKESGGLAKRIQGSVTVFRPRIPYADMAVALAVQRLVRSARTEVIHVHTTMDLPYAAFVKTFRPGLRVVYTKQMQPGKSKKDPFHQWVYGKIDLLLTVTEQMRSKLVDMLPMDRSRIKCLYLGTALPDIASKPLLCRQVRKRFGLTESDFLIVFPNRLDPQKGQELLIHALAQVKRRGLMPHVLFAGEETVGCEGYRAVLKSAVEKAGVASQCTFTGFIEDLGPLYAAADIVALATHEETFGMVLIEGMAWSTPVIGSNAGGVVEIIEHGKNGFLFTTRDATSLAATIERCMWERNTLPELGRYARMTVENKFTYSKHMQALEKYLQGIE